MCEGVCVCVCVCACVYQNVSVRMHVEGALLYDVEGRMML